GLVVLQGFEGPDDSIEGLPVAGCLAGSAVDDEVLGRLRHLGVQVVHEHAQGGLLNPALAPLLAPSGGSNDPLHFASSTAEKGSQHSRCAPAGEDGARFGPPCLVLCRIPSFPRSAGFERSATDADTARAGARE